MNCTNSSASLLVANGVEMKEVQDGLVIVITQPQANSHMK